jgi:subtilisin family serine protease
MHKSVQFLCLFVVVLLGLMILPSTVRANEGKWVKFCIDIYIIAPKTKDGTHVYDSYRSDKGAKTSSLPASSFNDKGIATFKPGDKIPGENRLRDTLKRAIADTNRVFAETDKTTKKCKVWFESARIHFIDPSKATANIKFRPPGKKSGKLDDADVTAESWLDSADDQGFRGINPEKKVHGYSFLSWMEHYTKQQNLDSGCLTMVIAPFGEDVGGEHGRARVGRNHLIVDQLTIGSRKDGGLTGAHELVHVLGLGGHTKDEMRPVPVDHGKGKIDIRAGTENNPQNLSLIPYITPEDCEKLCKSMLARLKDTGTWLVKPVYADPPKDYLVGPPEPVKAKDPPKTVTAPLPKPAAKCEKPKAVAVDKLPVMTGKSTAADVANMTETWRATLPPAPEKCCGTEKIDEQIKTAQDMLKRIDANLAETRKARIELNKAWGKARGAKSRQLGEQIELLEKAYTPWNKFRRDVRERLNELKKFKRKNKGKTKAEDCEHAFLIPGPPLFPLDPREDSHAVKFAYSEPERCVATTFYVGERVYSEQGEPSYYFGEPVSTAILTDQIQPTDGMIPECPGGSVPPAGPVTLVPGSGGIPNPDLTSGLQEDEPRGVVATGTPTSTPEDQEVPVASVPQDQDQPKDTPTHEKDMPATTEVVDTPVASVPVEDEPDLGLVKAVESVMRLVFEAGADLGDAVSQSVVKLIDPEPELPAEDGEPDPGLISGDNYLTDVQGDPVGKDGVIEVALNDGVPTAVVPQPQVVDEEAEQSQKEPVKQVIQVERPTHLAMVVAGGAAGAAVSQSATGPVGVAMAGGLPSSLLPPNRKACISRRFTIGETPLYVVQVPKDLIETFTRNATESGYSWVEPDPCRNKEEANDPHHAGSGLWGQDFDNQWAIKRVGFEPGEDTDWPPDPALLEPVTVAVIDSGLDWYHPDLPQSALWRNPGETPANGEDDDGNGYVDDVIGWNFIDNNPMPWDHDGHGTFVAGVIAAGQNNAKGIAGINPAARIMVLKALDAFGRGQASMVAEAIAYAADNGARVINLSLGGRTLTKVEQLAVDHARSKGALIVVAAGNAGKEVKDYAPAGLAGVVTVSASDRNDRRAGFSNWGPLVDIAAPGVDVLSLRARKTDLLSLIPGVTYEKGKGIVGEDRAYFRASGTSFAAPIVSGTLSLILARNPALTADEATRMVLQSARDIETPGFDNFSGYGLIDARAALKASPDYFVEARIHAVKVVSRADKQYLRVIGTADADRFEAAEVMIGAGDSPTKWRKLKTQLKTARRNAPLIDLPAGLFKGAKQWTIRILTLHKDGSKREARFKVTLG